MSHRSTTGLLLAALLIAACDDRVSSDGTPADGGVELDLGAADASPDRGDSPTPDAEADAQADPVDAMPSVDAMVDAGMRSPTETTPLDGPVPEQPRAVELPADAELLPELGRPCRGDLYVIDGKPEGVLPLGAGLYANLGEAMQALARERFAVWFCAPDEPCEGGERLVVRSAPLFQAELVGEADAERFLQLWFEVDGARLEVRDVAQCDVLRALRSEILNVGSDVNSYVGRACDAVAQSPSAPTAEMRTWHLERLGLRPDGAVGPPDPNAPPVHIALIDTGIDPAVAEAIGAVDHAEPGDAPALHGTAMAILARQAAPDARIHVFPALGPDHAGPLGGVAHAIARALAALPAGEPVVLNLSLGWPPELNRHTRLTGTVLDGVEGQACEAVEDPTATPVRWILGRAAVAGRPVFVAAGNRDDEAWLNARVVEEQPVFDRCAQDWQAEIRAQPSKLFYPAQWGLERTCLDEDPPESPGRRLAIPISAVDSRDQAATLSTPYVHVPLFAPGQHIVVDAPADRRPPSICVDGDTEPPRAPPGALRLPATLSGTSAATALTSGLAARFLGAVAARGLDARAIDLRTIELLLYAAAEPVCLGRRAFEDDFRRVAWPRLGSLAACPTLDAALDCLAANDDDAPLPRSAVPGACAEALSACGAPPPDAVDCPSYAVPDWRAAECTPLRDAGPDAPDLTRTCDGGCPFDALAPDRYSVGTVGPQPQDPWCPDCRFNVQPPPGGGPALVTLDIALNPSAPADTEIVLPVLWVEDDLGGDAYVTLEDYVPLPYWKPGAGFSISGVKVSVPDPMVDWSKVDARLVLYVEQPDGKTIVRDLSPLRVILP